PPADGPTREVRQAEGGAAAARCRGRTPRAPRAAPAPTNRPAPRQARPAARTTARPSPQLLQLARRDIRRHGKICALVDQDPLSLPAEDEAQELARGRRQLRVRRIVNDG